jgi:hypothetical protein
MHVCNFVANILFCFMRGSLVAWNSMLRVGNAIARPAQAASLDGESPGQYTCQQLVFQAARWEFQFPGRFAALSSGLELP